jgi:hypothetical protein
MLIIAAIAMSQIGPEPSRHVGDGRPLVDPMRPITEISRTSVTLQYFTRTPCETRVEYRSGGIPMVTFGAVFNQKKTVAKSDASKTTLHRITLSNLEPSTRYFYRVWDPGAKPTSEETNWGASDGWRREFAVSTQGTKGQKTIIHLPVKVLLMPNVINVESAHPNNGVNVAPHPEALTDAQIQKVRDEFAVSSRFFWINSGMRLWVDYQIFVDPQWQRWGPEPAKMEKFYAGWPMSRSYGGKDYSDPGGGDFTIVDTKDIKKVSKKPIPETKPYSGQVEVAFVRKWNGVKWEFYTSGGGTFGVDGFPQGFPGRSQFLGGGDLAWLATHEFHHNLESHGQFSLANREDERIVFNHPAPRFRRVRGDGSAEENPWNTAGRSGEHWQTMWVWDRSLSDAQWLRMYFGYTLPVKDADEDGFPDDDSRLPLDERRFGSSSAKPATDGSLPDLQKAMLSTWAPGPLYSTWLKEIDQTAKPNPTKVDSDGDGLADSMDPYPLIPFAPYIYPQHASLDGDVSEWKDVPLAGRINKGGIEASYQQASDEAGYYGLLTLKGPWRRIQAGFDGEGFGIYSNNGTQGFEATNLSSSNRAPGPSGGIIDVRPYLGRAPGLKWKASKTGDEVRLEFMWPNRGEGIWYWDKGGREIGSSFTIFDAQGRAYSLWEPYQLFYSLMLEPSGREPMPSNAPREIPPLEPVKVLKPGDPAISASDGWKLEDGAYRHSGSDEGALVVKIPRSTEFDLFVVLEGRNDGILGAFTSATKKPSAITDYIAFLGGYGNRSTRFRLFGREVGDETIGLSPGPNRVQLTRRDSQVWLLANGKPILWAPDPNPKAAVDRLAILGGYGGEQVVREIRYRL